MLIHAHRFSAPVAALLCIFLLAGQVSVGAQAPAPSKLAKLKQVALAVPQGSPVQVQMNDKSWVNGRIGAVDNEGFELQYIDHGTIVSKKVAFEEINKLAPGPRKNALQRMMAPALAVIGIMGTAGALTAALK